MHALTLPVAPPQVEVIALSPREWRVSDPTKVERDGRALIGFVEHVGAQYEVTALCDPRKRTRCRTFNDALNELMRSGGAATA